MGKKLYFVALVVMLVGYQMMPGRASSHREAPLISGDPQADTTDVYAFVSPDAPDTVTLIASWRPVRGSRRRPELLQVRRQRPVRDQDRQQRRRRRGHHLPVPLHVAAVEPEHVPLQHRPDHGARRSEPQHVSDLHGDARRSAARTVFTAGPMLTMYDNVGPASTPELRRQRQRHLRVHAGGRHGGRVFAGQTDDPFFLDLRVFDLLYGGEPVARPASTRLAGFNVHSIAMQVPKASLRRRRARSSASGRPPAVRPRPRARPARRPARRLRAGVASRHAARQRSRDSGRPEGQVERQQPDRRCAVPRATSPIRKCRSCCRRSTASPRRRRRATISCPVFLTGVPGLNQPARRAAVGDAAAEHRHRARPRAQPPGRPRGRRRGLPERPPADRRRDRHHAAGRGRRRSRGASVRRSAMASTSTTCRSGRRSRTSAQPHSGGNPWKLNPNPPPATERRPCVVC